MISAGGASGWGRETYGRQRGGETKTSWTGMVVRYADLPDK